MTEQELRDLAESARSRAHAPYSHFHVGCAIETVDGHVAIGCNVENASYGLTICAERAAVAAAIAAGHTALRRLILVSDAPDPITPCGACRQVLAEFSATLAVTSFGTNGERLDATIADMLPGRFTAASLHAAHEARERAANYVRGA